MTDLQLAKDNLSGHTISLCKDGSCIFSDARGIAPMMSFIADGVDLSGYSVADLVVGKAVAMLFVKCGIKQVYAKTLSVSGREILQRYAVPYEFDVLADVIINRIGNDICPMEKALADCDDINKAYHILKNKLKSLSNRK